MIENGAILVGNLTREPELKFTTGGVAVCEFGLAHSKRYKNDKGEWVDGDTSFFNVVVWRELGENVAASFSKGNRVIVIGELRQRSWETDEGQKRSVVEVVATEVGPSLKWGTTQYERVTRTAGGAPDGGPSRTQPNEPVYGDEEPF